MSNTIYASFPDPSLAEKAVGALLDHGVRAEDISVVSSHSADGGQSGSTNRQTHVGTAGPATTDSASGGTMGGAGTVPGSTSAEWNDQAERHEARTTGAETYSSDSVSSTGSGTPTTTYSGTGSTGATGGAVRHMDANDMNTANSGYGDTAARTNRVDDENRSGGGDTETAAKQGISTTTGADAGSGAIKGAGWGLGIGAVAALASLIVPGVGIVLGGGALAAALGGLAATTGAGAVAGAVTGYLKDQGVEANVAENYEKTVAGGGALVAVTVPSGNIQEDEIRTVLQKYGGANVNSYASRGGYVA